MQRPIRHLVPAWLLAGALALSPCAVLAQGSAPQIERPIAFDAAGHVTVVTPTLAARWKLSAPEWPLGVDWKDARLYATDGGAAVLVAQRVDGTVARYAYVAGDLAALRRVIDAAVLAQGSAGAGTRGSTGFELSEPAGNVFVRNQTVLGLFAYGPATAAILSDNGAAAGGGYLLAAGTSFFVAARMVRNRSVSRAQTILAFHGGTRGSLAGAAIAAIARADGGAGYGAPILAGALGGTIAGFHGAKGMSDGEAASSGFGADLSAATTIGLVGALGAFDEDTSYHGDGPPPRARPALGAAIAAGVAGYWVGPRYARRSAYNVTAGDIDMVFTSAALGALATNAVFSNSTARRTGFAVSTAGMLAGAAIADRLMVRRADRTSADGTLAQLGAVAGMLMGGGVAIMADVNRQPGVALVAAGGALGLVAADRILAPSPDAGPKRGVLPSESSSGLYGGSSASSRVSLSIIPAATSIALGMSGTRTARPTRQSLMARPTITNVPVMRIAF
ncbi:MAG: hypothetical protein IPP90_06550 [Gemmatimonadaceae bacterium]|nr:hypothetical protein [Gemmatimonadaceae bacterium]